MTHRDELLELHEQLKQQIRETHEAVLMAMERSQEVEVLRCRVQQLEAENVAMIKTLDDISENDAAYGKPYKLARLCIETVPNSTAFADYVNALEAVAEAATNFDFRIQPEDKIGISPWIDLEDVKEMNNALQKLEQAKREYGK